MEKQKLPNATSSLVFGIVSIVTACCCFGLPGVIFGVIGLNQSKKAIALNEEDPTLYDGVGNANTGKITSIIGIVLGALAILQILFSIFISGTFGEQMELIKEAIEQAQ